MLLRRFAAVSTALVTSLAFAPAITHADSPSASTLYVSNNPGANCSDAAGAGTQAQPFCTIQAAVNIVNPGQTISIAFGTYDPVTITRSGTAAAPINITGYWPANARAGRPPFVFIGSTNANWAGPALTISGASYVNVTHIGMYAGSSGGLMITHSSNITLNRTKVLADSSDSSAPMVDITGASSAVTFERSLAFSGTATGIEVEGGSTGTVLSTDEEVNGTGATTPSIVVDNAPSTDIVGNTLPLGCQEAIQVLTGSTQALIENNVLGPATPGSNCQSPPVVAVATTVSSTATDDYNSLAAVADDYSWNGVLYATPAAFTAATGQGAHDLVYTSVNASVIDSANSAAPNELSTDAYEQPRVDDPQVANTGGGSATYYDRGAFETQEPLTINSFVASARQAPTGGTVTFTAAATDSWTSNLVYKFDFGDGTSSTTTSPTTTHIYTTTGSFTTSVSVTGSDGVPVTRTYPITVVPAGPFTAAMSLTSAGTMTVEATQQSIDPWNITSFTVDFGDGTMPNQAGYPTPALGHNYTKLGTYTITMTSTDSQGNTASVSEPFTTAGSEYTAFGPVRVLDTRHGTGTGGVVAKLGPNQTFKLKIAGNGTIPPNVSAVAFNLTVTGPSANGYLVAYPDGQAKPATSNLNFIPGQTKATNVIVGVGDDGYVSLYNGSAGTVDLVADVNGYFTKSEATKYTPMNPNRILDTRHAIGTGGVIAPVGAGQTLTLWISAGQDAPLPGKNVSAVALNLTAVDEASGGYVTAYPDGTARPLASSVNFTAGQIVPNTVIVPVGSDGKIDLYNGSGGTIDLVADLEGYFGADSTDAYLPVAPQRIYDSRGVGAGGPFTNCCNTGVDLQPLGVQPILQVAFSDIANVLNVTVTQTVGAGYVTVYPDDQTKPVASNVNFTANQTTANTAIAAGSVYSAMDEFAFTFTLPASSSQLVVDLFGYFSVT